MDAALLAASHGAAAPDISIGHLLLQMAVAMGLIVGAIWGFSKLVGRSRAAGRSAGRRAGALLRQRRVTEGLTILSRQPLGKGKYLAVVQVGIQQFLVGIADSGLTPLGELHTGGDEPGPRHCDVGLEAAADVGGTTAGAAFGGAGLTGIDLQALGVAGRSPAQSELPAAHSIRGWVDALREATVRR